METQEKTIPNFLSISTVPVDLVSLFQSLSVVTSSASQPLALGWILAASADPQYPSCWTVSAQSDSSGVGRQKILGKQF